MKLVAPFTLFSESFLRRSGRFWALVLACLMLLLSVSESRAVPPSSDEFFANPERGWYAHREVQAEGNPLTVDDLVALREGNETTLILRLYYLKSFRDRPLSDRQLELMEKDFETIRAAGVKAILRFAYSQNEHEPDAPLDTILKHLEQMKPVLTANSDVIALVQAGFIGAWGEWHFSSEGLTTTPARKAVVGGWLAALPENRMIQVRTPGYKRDIFCRLAPLSASEAFSGRAIARIGHHNDCFLASENDLGTYRDIQAETAYLERETRFTPMGGETCHVNLPRSGCVTALEELERFHWSYLHSGYHADVLENWRRDGCIDEVTRRLGYRLTLLDVRAASSVRSGEKMRMVFQLKNEGWAAPFNPREVNVVVRHRSSGKEFSVKLDEDPRLWQAGETVVIAPEIDVPSNMPGGDYDLFLHLADPEPRLRFRPEYAIRLANQDVWEEKTGYNRLHHSVTVFPSVARPSPSGQLTFEPVKR